MKTKILVNTTSAPATLAKANVHFCADRSGQTMAHDQTDLLGDGFISCSDKRVHVDIDWRKFRMKLTCENN